MIRSKVKSVYVNSKSKRIYIEFFDNNGEVKQKSTKLLDTSANQKMVREQVVPAFERELEQGRSLKENKTFSDYADDYIELNQKHARLNANIGRIKRMEEYFGADTKLQDINELQINKFMASLDIRRSTKKDWLTILRKMYEYAIQENVIRRSDCFMVNYRLPGKNEKPDEKSVKPFEAEEVALLLENTTGDLLNYLGIGFYSGMRPEEIIALMISDIDLEARLINVRRAISKGSLKSTKTGNGVREVPLFSTVKVFIEDQIKKAIEKKSLFLFSDEHGQHLDDIEDIRGKKSKNGIWYQVLDRLDMEYRVIKNTRHTFAVEAIKSGEMTSQEIAAILGHADLRSLHNNYAKYLGKSHLRLDRDMDIFTKRKTGSLTGSRKVE